MFLHEYLRSLPLRRRPYSFRFNTSLIAVFSNARSAYIRLSFAFSAFKSLSRLSSETLTPPYFGLCPCAGSLRRHHPFEFGGLLLPSASPRSLTRSSTASFSTATASS
jgi:hypothetical protein